MQQLSIADIAVAQKLKTSRRLCLSERYQVLVIQLCAFAEILSSSLYLRV